jgi:hypothetical protein
MKTTTMKNFAGLTYVTVLNIPIKRSDFGDVIDVQPRELERLVAIALIENKIPIRGAEFRVFKSAIGMSNEEIGENWESVGIQSSNGERRLKNVSHLPLKCSSITSG